MLDPFLHNALVLSRKWDSYMVKSACVSVPLGSIDRMDKC